MVELVCGAPSLSLVEDGVLLGEGTARDWQ